MSDSSKALDALREVLNSVKTKDTFEMGTVIRWTAAGKYTYAAIKTAVGWATTARAGNAFIGGVVTYEELVEYLSKSETSEIAVATEWADL